MNTWNVRGTAAAVCIAAVIAGVGGAAVYAATDSGPRMMGMHGGPGPGQGDHQGRRGHDVAGDAMPDSASVHGEFVVDDGSGGFTTMVSQTGRVTAISDASITARSDDGYTRTYVIPAANPGGAAAIPPFAVNDEVTIRATRTGPTASVTTVTYARTRGGPAAPPLAPGHP
jgi:hypothetical protein